MHSFRQYHQFLNTPPQTKAEAEQWLYSLRQSLDYLSEVAFQIKHSLLFYAQTKIGLQ